MDEARVDVEVTSIAEMAKNIAGLGTPAGGASQAEVLRQIAQAAGTVTRGEIAVKSGLSTATVSKAVAHLMQLKLVHDGTQGGQRRPGAALRWTKHCAQVGVMISTRDGHVVELIGTVTKLDGTPLPSFRAAAKRQQVTDGTPEGVLKGLSVFVHELLREATQVDPADMPKAVLGCGVSVGGHVGTEGTVRKSFNTGWPDNVKLEADLAGRLKADGLPLDVVVENDVTSYAIYKNLTSRPADSYALIAVLRDGVGGAVVVDEKAWRGHHGLAGEIGHIYVGSRFSDDDSPLSRGEDPRCSCGRVGCVQAFATPNAIFQKVRGAKDFHERDFLELASQPHTDTTVRDAFHQAGTALGRGLAPLIYWFDPGMIFLYIPPALVTDNRFLAGHAYLEGVRGELRDYVFIGDSTDLDPDALLVPEPKTEDELKELGAEAAATAVLGRLIRQVRDQPVTR